MHSPLAAPMYRHGASGETPIDGNAMAGHAEITQPALAWRELRCRT